MPKPSPRKTKSVSLGTAEPLIRKIGERLATTNRSYILRLAILELARKHKIR